MEFLYKLYDKEYFGIVLFGVIAILIFLFLIILFFGKKDEKNRKLEETRRLELEAANGFKETTENIEELNIPIIEQPIYVKEEDLKTDEILDTDLTLDSMVVNPQLEENLATIDNVNNELKNNIINELEFKNEVEEKVLETTEEKNKLEQPFMSEFDIDNLFQTNIKNNQDEEDNVEEIKLEEPEEEIKTEIEVAPKVEAPFSSVYINNDLPKVNEESKDVEIKEDIKKENNMFELPKIAEMPKLNKESKEEIEEVPKVEKVADFDSLFGGIEMETYNINK